MITATEIGRSALSNTELVGAVRSHNLIASRQAWMRFDEAVPASARLAPQPELRAVIERDYAAIQHMILGDVHQFEWIVEQLDPSSPEIWEISAQALRWVDYSQKLRLMDSANASELRNALDARLEKGLCSFALPRPTGGQPGFSFSQLCSRQDVRPRAAACEIAQAAGLEPKAHRQRMRKADCRMLTKCSARWAAI